MKPLPLTAGGRRLVVQGEEDEYGTLRQVEAIKAGVAGAVETVFLPDCGHSPHRERPEETFQAIVRFLHTPSRPRLASPYPRHHPF